nr:MAG TPA: hypothetical protein [Caudoviricetes sp.]
MERLQISYLPRLCLYEILYHGRTSLSNERSFIMRLDI